MLLLRSLRVLPSSPLLSSPVFLRCTAAGLLPGTRRVLTTASPSSNDAVITAPPSNTPLDRAHSGAIWFDNLFPIRLHKWDFRHYLVNIKATQDKLEDMVHSMASTDITIEKIMSKEREGGAFVFFNSPTLDAESVADRLRNHLSANHTRTWLNSQEIRSHLVEGRPFIHDLSIYPSRKVRVDFVGKDLDLEGLYRVLRRYGRIITIEFFGGTKDLPRYAVVDFKHFHGAISSKNCVHGLNVDGARLNFTYQEMLKTHAVRDFFSKYSRYFLPLIIALMAALTYAIFDPIRVFFITNKLTDRFRLSQLISTDFIKMSTFGVINLSNSDDDTLPVWSDVKFNVETLLHSRPEAVIFLAGPTGSGKSGLLSGALSSVHCSLMIECGGQESGAAAIRHGVLVGEEKQLMDLVTAVGYFPSMTWLNTLSGSVEGLLTATTGVKASLSSSVQSQIQHVLECVTRALVSFGIQEGKKTTPTTPLIVIDGYTSVFKQEYPAYAKMLLDWASFLVLNGLAQVIFVADNNSAEDSFNQASGLSSNIRAKIDIVSLHDASYDKVVSYLVEHVEGLSEEKAQMVAQRVGGRLADVQSVLHKMQAGMTAEDAVEEVVKRAELFLRSSAFGVGTTEKLTWTKAQIWYLFNLLARNEGEVSYDEVLFGPFFNGDEEPLRALQRAELITVVRAGGNASSVLPSVPPPASTPSTATVVAQAPGSASASSPSELTAGVPTGSSLRVRFGRPVFTEAFKRMAQDKKLGSGMIVMSARFLIDKHQAKLKMYEEELATLNNIAAKGAIARAGGHEGLNGRREFLLHQISQLSEKVAVLERQRAECEQQLRE